MSTNESEMTAEDLIGKILEAQRANTELLAKVEQKIAPALTRAHAQGYREGVEASAKVAEEFPAEVLHFYSRGPNDPPGNQKRRANANDIAAAIRSLTQTEEG